VCAEASAVLRAVAADFFFNCWCLEIPSDNRIRKFAEHVKGNISTGVRGIGDGIKELRRRKVMSPDR
jgi:hypothetical protein